jgi:hypothetical protein
VGGLLDRLGTTGPLNGALVLLLLLLLLLGAAAEAAG